MTQLRRTVSAPLRALFDSGMSLVTADLYTITLSGGTVIRWAEFDRVVTIGATTWTQGPGLQSNRLKMSAGVEVDTLQISLTADAGVQINGVPLMIFINSGGFDGATVLVERAFAAAPGTAWAGKLQRFFGRVSDIDRTSRVQADITIRDFFETFNVMLPRNVYQAGCLNSVYDQACGADKAAKTVSATVTTATDPLKLTFAASGLTQAAGYFSLGALVVTSGANNGVARTVRSHAAGGALSLMQPLPLAMAVGDTFNVYPGCDKTMAMCSSKFSNLLRFRGQPWIPVPESVL